MTIAEMIAHMKVLAMSILSVLVVIFAGLGLAYLQASFEARSYRKFCDVPVTAWDAIWLDLRIDECKKPATD